ncbi:GUN4 domain-containing protein [Phormidium sp. FACHB-1136]|uniref:GUN4 domain-containing protein n=1 Tax=Phormidium sp. FACHB-1136 TaxID=2692848 RepID=UPI001682297E|nr:GUN4 domain-containing protein [Phormidium sp. FACHB-1136]
MTGTPPNPTPTTLEKVFELLDQKLITLGVPGGLSAVGINNIRTGQWNEAALCFGGAAAVWMAIKVGNKLAPEIDQGLDHAIAAAKRLPQTLRTDFTSVYLRRQARQCEESTIEGFNPENTAIPLLEKVFVPLDLSGAIGALDQAPLRQLDPSLRSENLDIWKLLAKSRKNRQFRQMCILAKGGKGKTTLLRHITLLYGQGKRLHGAPKLVPVLLRLREWVDELSQSQPPGLAQLMTEHHIPTLWKNHPPQVPDRWAENLLNRGQALVMLDGFDEIPMAKRPQVSQWITTQMEDYDQSIFLLTSRPKGYENYTAKRPSLPIYINDFNADQQADFIRRWYLCQERCYRSTRRHAREAATEYADNLIAQIQARPEDLGQMAKNPLLLNLLVTLHRYAPTKALPSQRLGLYQRICSLQLDTRPAARLITMWLDYDKNMALLQAIALHMLSTPSQTADPNEERLVIDHHALLTLLQPHPILQKAQADPADWLKQIVDVSELLVEREPKEYEFPHASFQGFFAARELAQLQNTTIAQNLVLQNWNTALWRETVLLYTAQLDPDDLNDIIRKACELDSEAAQLAKLCLQEYPRPEKVDPDLKALLEDLETVTQNSTYAKLEELLKAGQWREADEETYRLMITNPAVGKEEGQWFDPKDLEEFPCEDLRILDQLWVKYSNGKFGFSVQKKIYVETGNPLDGKYHEDTWLKFADRVGWRKDGSYLSYKDLQANPSFSPTAEFPSWRGVWGWRALWVLLFSRAETCKL